MRFALIQLGLLLLACCACEGGVVQRRQRNAGEVLVPVTIVEDEQAQHATKRHEVPGDADVPAGEGVGEEQAIASAPQAPEVLGNGQGGPNREDETIDSTADVAVPPAVVDNQESEGSLRQATQATPAQTTQQNFVQQLIQNSPLGQFFNQISGQNTQALAANDETPATPAPTIPGFLAPAVTTFQNAAQTVVNSTTSAIQGLQQFASNLGTQFQSTLSGLGGQPPAQQSPVATTARPAGPFQQLVNTFMGNNNNANPQDTPTPPQGPLQGLLNIFQNNNNRPQQQPNGSVNSAEPVTAKPVAAQSDDPNEQPDASAANEVSNDLRSSHETEDSFEEPGQHEEMIVVQDDAADTHGSDAGPENDQPAE